MTDCLIYSTQQHPNLSPPQMFVEGTNQEREGDRLLSLRTKISMATDTYHAYSKKANIPKSELAETR